MAKKTTRQTERAEQIYQLTTLVAGNSSLQEVLDKLAEAAVRITAVKACSIRLLDKDAGDLKMRSTYGLSEKYRNKGAVSKEDLSTIAHWYEDAGFARLFDATPVAPRNKSQWTKWLEDQQDANDGFLFAIRETNAEAIIGYLELDGILWTHGNGWLGIGLGDRKKIDSIEVRWIGGGVDVVKDVAVDQCLTITEGSGKTQ